MLKNVALGRAGELRVASELLLREYEVFLTLVDSGADLILSNGKRIQVKTSHKVKKPGLEEYSHYVFTFKSWRQKKGKYEAHQLADIDFVILWAIEDDFFFIIPAELVRGKYSIQLGCHLGYHRKRGWSKYLAFKDNWESLKKK